MLLTAPLWSLPLDFGEQVHEYEHAEVTANGSPIESATDRDDPSISDEIGCSGYFDTRVCAFESSLAANHSIPTGWQSAPEPSNYTSVPGLDCYQYVRVDGQIYDATYTTGDPHASSNASADGLTRIYLAQEPVTP